LGSLARDRSASESDGLGLERAADYWRETIEILQEMGYERDQIGTRLLLSDALSRMGAFLEAVQHLQIALHACQRSGWRSDECTAFMIAGTTFLYLHSRSAAQTNLYIAAADSLLLAQALYQESGYEAPPVLLRGLSTVLPRLAEKGHQPRTREELMARYKEDAGWPLVHLLNATAVEQAKSHFIAGLRK
jgi:hypothetical protein